MPTAGFPMSASIVCSGQWSDLTIGGHNARSLVGQHGQLDFIAIGTALTLLSFLGSGSVVQISVDGGAFTNVTFTADAWASCTLFTGLSDTAHAVALKNTGSTVAWYLDRDATLSLTGASPALNAPAGFGPQYVIGSASVAPSLQLEGGWNDTTQGFYATPPAKNTLFPNARLTFRAQCGTIKVWTYQSGVKLQLTKGGANVATVATSPLNQWGWVTLAAGLDTSQPATYALEAAYTGTDGQALLYALMLVGGTGLVAMTFAARPLVAAYGDSITRAESGTGNDATIGFLHQLGVSRNMAVSNRGIGGSTVHQFASGTGPQTTQAGEASGRVTDITTLAPAPDTVIILYGTNDVALGIASLLTTSQFQTSYQNMLNALLAGATGVRQFLCLGILPRQDINAAARAPWSAIISNVVAGLSSSRLTFVAMEGVIDDSAGSADLFDAVHPNATGHGKIAAFLLPYLGQAPLTSLNVARERLTDDGVTWAGGTG